MLRKKPVLWSIKLSTNQSRNVEKRIRLGGRRKKIDKFVKIQQNVEQSQTSTAQELGTSYPCESILSSRIRVKRHEHSYDGHQSVSHDNESGMRQHLFNLILQLIDPFESSADRVGRCFMSTLVYEQTQIHQAYSSSFYATYLFQLPRVAYATFNRPSVRPTLLQHASKVKSRI